MARKLASIVRIAAVSPIPDADRLEVIEMEGKGWRVVTSKGEFHPGDLAVYFEIDSYLPPDDERYAFLRERCLRKFVSKGGSILREGLRIKTVKLRGVVSQGLVMPVAKFPELAEGGTALDVGRDVTAELQVDHFDEVAEAMRPVEGGMGNVDAMGPFPGFIPKTDEERIQNLAEYFTTMRGRLFEVTEKNDGTSVTMFYAPSMDEENPFGVCTRNQRIKPPSDDGNVPLPWRAARKCNAETAIREACDKAKAELAFQGELVGPGVNANRDFYRDWEWHVFRIWNISSASFVPPGEARKLCAEVGLQYVPVIAESMDVFGTLTDIDSMLAFAEGKTARGNEREGLVFKSVDAPFVQGRVQPLSAQERIKKGKNEMTTTNSTARLAAMIGVAAFAAQAAVTWYAVDPMSERQYMPDAAPIDGLKGEPVRIVAAQGEYEPGSFVLTADADLGKVDFAIPSLKGEGGAIIQAAELDLKTVKVWYQAGNAWFSYFQDTNLKLCPELLLHDEDLVRVDTKKVANYARLTEKDGTVHWHWLTSPRAIENRTEDAPNYRIDDAFLSMKENFKDAPSFAGATIEKGKYKQFLLTVHVPEGAKAGLYSGEIVLRRRNGGETVGSVPVRLRVLPFALPEPCTFFDWNKEFRTWFCEYVSLDHIRAVNGNDKELAERQLKAILADFVRHNETIASFREATSRPEFAREVGMDIEHVSYGSMLLSWNKAEMRFAARRLREKAERVTGKPLQGYASWGDEYGLSILRGIRAMVRIYHEEGFKFPVNSRHGYAAGGYLSDLYWPPNAPDLSSKNATEHYNNLGGEGLFGWYACQHVGVENPAFIRRQYGMGPYRAGFGCNFNYAHHLQGWNDISHDTYRPMMFVYGCGSGCLDTIQWEAFREAIDDIRYATLLQRLARPLADSKNVEARYAAKKALQFLSDLDGDDYDLGATRLEIVRHILALRECGK